MPDESVSEFGKNLRRARDVRRLSQPKLAEFVEVKAYNISRWETSKIIPSLDVIAKLEDVLVVVDLQASESDFIERNDLYINYPGMQYFPLYETNRFSEDGQFEHFVDATLDNVVKYAHYTHLCVTPKRKRDHYNPRELMYRPFVTRLLNKEVVFERLEIFFSKEEFIEALRTLIRFQSTPYEVRFYGKPPTSYPVINMRSYDHQIFVIGGHEPKVKFHNNCILLEGREPIGSFLRNYWDAAWDSGGPTEFNFDTASKVAETLEIEQAEWQKIRDDIIATTTPELSK